MVVPKLDTLVEWTGSQEEFSNLISSILESSGFAGGKKISKRTIIYYRSKGLISKATGKIYEYKHILQCLFALKLSYEGWKIKQMAEIIPFLDESKLLSYLGQSVTFNQLIQFIKKESTKDAKQSEPLTVGSNAQITSESAPLPQLAVHILAHGIVKQYHLNQIGQIVDGSHMPDSLRHALGLLGKLRILEGKTDNCASLHEVLVRATQPLFSDVWGIGAFKDQGFPYGNITLIDSDHRCPTLECMELAQPNSDSDLREKYSFERLKRLCDTFGARRHEVYSRTREFIIRKPLVASQTLLSFIREENLTTLSEFLQFDCYTKLGEHHLIDGHLFRCQKCGAVLKQVQKNIGRCPTRQCQSYQVDEALIEYDEFSDAWMVLRPHLQLYWFGPGLDEVAVYDACVDNNLKVELYPNSDECDLAIDGNDVGIDIKSYTSPTYLGESLTRSIGGLVAYDRKIIAINDNCLKSNKYPDYIKTLKSEYKGNEELEFMAVSELLDWINENDN